jgi:hypothetical protein
MAKRLVIAATALGVSLGALAMQPANPLDPMYKPPAFNDIHKGEGAMTQDEYMNYVNRSWTENGGKDIDKSNPRYSDYQKNPRFELMDKNRDGSISQEEYSNFHKDAWSSTKRQSMSQQDFDAWYQDSSNPLHPSYKKN